MNDPNAYDAHSEMQRKEASELIPTIVSKMKWKPNETILDFGCGNGFVTKNILMPLLEEEFPDKCRQIVALDISEKMVKFASENYPHPKISYVAMDILGERNLKLPIFDKIFSFYVLNWVEDLKHLFETFYNIMTPDGELGIYCTHNAPLFNVLERLRQDPIWAPYHYDLEHFMSRTRKLVNPDHEIYRLLSSIGFCVQESKLLTRTFTFKTWDHLLEALLAVSPFLKRVPVEMREAYKDSLSHALEIVLLEISPESIPLDDKSSVTTAHEIIFMRAKKIIK